MLIIRREQMKALLPATPEEIADALPGMKSSMGLPPEPIPEAPPPFPRAAPVSGAGSAAAAE